MRHLPGGDTGINKWPVRLRKLQEMQSCSQEVHDEIFSHEPPVESGDEAPPGGATIDDLVGDKKVVPFPREHVHHLTRQMMDKEGGIGADVLVAVHCGSGESLKAILHESGGKRGVGIARNVAHKKFVLDNLREDVRINKRATVNYPPMPKALVEYERKLKGTGGVPPVPQAKATPAMPAAPAATVVPASSAAGTTPTGAPAGAFGDSRLM